MEATQTLDDTLKELMGEGAEAAATQESEADKPKRTRRTKAQIAADEAAGVAASESSDEVEATEGEAVAAPEESTESAPEIIPDSEEDKADDITEVPQEAEVEPQVLEESAPEIIPDSEEDALPDVPRERRQPEPEPPRGEAVEAFDDATADKKKTLVGRQIILTTPTAMYRARHLSMKVKSYQGLVTVIEDPRDGFVQVQFLRQGFGLCKSFMSTMNLLPYLQSSDSDEEGGNNVQESEEA